MLSFPKRENGHKDRRLGADNAGYRPLDWADVTGLKGARGWVFGGGREAYGPESGRRREAQRTAQESLLAISFRYSSSLDMRSMTWTARRNQACVSFGWGGSAGWSGSGIGKGLGSRVNGVSSPRW